MAITSWPFSVFVLVTLALYFVLPRRGQMALLLAASYVFYASWSWHFPLVLLGLTAANHGIARRLGSAPSKSWLAVGIGLNVAALGLLKYAGFLVPEVLRFAGTSPGDGLSRVLEILLPVGLSYRVLENVSYLLDVSRGQVGRLPGWLEYSLYVAYFPKLLSGPIERGRAFLAQLAKDRKVDNDVLARAGTLIAVGALRKLVIADSLRGVMPPGLFVRPLEYAGVSLLPWLLVDVFVVYNDFAGYTDMIRGVSLLFGLDLSRNFSWPLFARNFSELWTRWHISLSQWLRDYVYMPLSRALLRRGVRPGAPANLIVPPLAAMLVSAVWHGASLHLLLWGCAWGLFLVVGRIQSLWRPVVPPDRQSPLRRLVGVARVWLLLASSTALFEMSLPVAGDFFRAAFAGTGTTWSILPALPFMAVSLAVDAVQLRSNDETVFRRWPLWARSLALAAVILLVFLATRFKAAEPFIYQGF